jgi:hypothetical protein
LLVSELIGGAIDRLVRTDAKRILV